MLSLGRPDRALLVVHWFGDSLDGTLARVRKIERPRYGYYLDHLTDAVAMVLIGLGLGLSPFMLLATGLLIVILYLVLSINVYLETYALLAAQEPSACKLARAPRRSAAPAR